ncbi:MAG: hypothetical protein DCO96_05960 [Fluviicola sp. XM-24bin1]|nr:MAG: hypothetical protein DCO96_05960 [Fluviicola sp. XM-24bin1]
MKKRITKYLGGIALLSVLALFSCQKEGELNRTERKLVGTWTFEQANLQSGLFSSDDVMSEYDADKLTLKADYTAEYYDDETESTSYGTWTKSTETVDDCVTTVLTLEMTRSSNNEAHQMELHHVTVTKKKLKGGMETPDGKCDFVLVRQ